ncbi:MAG: YajD family HNH nuclease [Proteobacteria bacterium]|nr:YajD family HNH nuclease [Pseudomonadota bacterium]
MTGQDDRSNVVKEALRNREERERGYRERAMKLFPHVCGRCGREFSGKRLKELTVHHRDHDHGHNPPDGSNWELLCLYCHDNEHSRNEVADAYAQDGPGNGQASFSTHRPFGALENLLKKKE